MLSNICKFKTFGFDLCKRYFCYFWWKWTLKFTKLPSGTFALLAFICSYGSGAANISHVRVIFTMQHFLVRLANVPINSNVTKGFIREMHVDIVLQFKLFFHWFPASQFGHIDRHMVVNSLIFVVFQTTCPMTYLSTSLHKSFCYCWWEELAWCKFSTFAFEYVNRFRFLEVIIIIWTAHVRKILVSTCAGIWCIHNLI